MSLFLQLTDHRLPDIWKGGERERERDREGEVGSEGEEEREGGREGRKRRERDAMLCAHPQTSFTGLDCPIQQWCVHMHIILLDWTAQFSDAVCVHMPGRDG